MLENALAQCCSEAASVIFVPIPCKLEVPTKRWILKQPKIRARYEVTVLFVITPIITTKAVEQQVCISVV